MRTNRIRGHDRRYYLGQHRHHGVNLPGLTDPYGRLIWISDGLPGSTHDLSTARTHGVFAVADRAQLYLYADKGDVGGVGRTLLTPDQGAPWRTPTGTPTAATPRSAPPANAASPS